jgi:superfamily II DNA or RNA helicase
MKIVIKDNKFAQILSDDTDFLKKLHKELSFKQDGVEYTPAYRNGWNGYTYLLTKTNKFPIGLLDRVKEFATNYSIEFIIEDLRPKIEILDSIDISKKLHKLKLDPRDYQLEAVKAANENQRGIIRAATGAGKSLISALITAYLNKPTTVYVIGLDLLKQFHDLFSEIFNEEIGFIGDGICEVRRINIATVWTIGRTLSLKKSEIFQDEEDEDENFNPSNTQKILKMLSDTRVHLLDECHICTTDTINALYKNINPEHLYGLSGTPYRDDNTDLLVEGILGKKIIDISASLLIDRGVLAQPIIKFVPVPNISMPMEQYQTVYKNYIVENVARNNLIVNQTKDLLSKKYTPLVLFKTIKHGEILFEMMKDTGIKCEMLYGNDSIERRFEVKQMLIDKEIDVILASTIFDLGIDLPILSALVLAGGGKSSIRAVQRIGRVIRKFKGKTRAAIVDFYDQTKFLKKHSVKRYKIYSSEKGFKVIKCKEMSKA